MDDVRLEIGAEGPAAAPLNGNSRLGPELSTGLSAGLRARSNAVNWETTRYLAAATQLDLAYAAKVVGRIIGEPFRAVAPAAGADVVVVTRWALAALRRRAQRDGALAGLLMIALIWTLLGWTWLPLAVSVVPAAVIVGYEQWVRDEKVIARLMLKDRFHAQDAPTSPSPRIEERLAAVKEQQNGNLVVFEGRSAFIGSGQRARHNRIVIDVSAGRRKKKGKRLPPIPFTNPELHAALEAALENMDLPDLRVIERLFVNGQHVAADPRLLPSKFGPPAASAPPSLLYRGCIHPTPEARTYLCAEIGGWKGQLVVSLYVRAVQARGSLHVEWTFQVLPPLHSTFLQIDRRYEMPRFRQYLSAAAAGALRAVPSLTCAPVQLLRYASVPARDRFRQRKDAYAIRNGIVFNYGSQHSIREDAIGHTLRHFFLAQDHLTFAILAEHTMFRALDRFLRDHNIDMTQFEAQQQTFINKVSNYRIGDVNARNVSVGNKSRVDGRQAPPFKPGT
jgi:hypothetical protein